MSVFSNITEKATENETGLTIQLVNDLVVASLGEICGMDTEDREYNSLQSLWNYELSSNKKPADLSKGKKVKK